MAGVVGDVGVFKEVVDVGVGVVEDVVGVASNKCWRHGKCDFPVSWAVGEAPSLENVIFSDLSNIIFKVLIELAVRIFPCEA